MASQSWIVKMPDVEYSKEITNRAWQIETAAPAIYMVGGNPAQ